MKLNVIPSNEVYPHSLPNLPYPKDGLLPHITEETINYHYGKHHQAYVDNLNNLLKESDLKDKTLEDLILLSSKDSTKAPIFNNAAQIWNHTFYWHCMKPNGGGQPSGEIAKMIDRDFKSFTDFAAEFKQAALTQFGSGWAWLVLTDSNHLKIIKTSNADLPMNHGYKALLTIDVWEHAYYVDYRNKRADYINIFFDNLINWDFANKNLVA